MGIPIPPGPPEYGPNCTVGENCTPPLWAVDETPKYVYASFSGIELCPFQHWPDFGNPNGQQFKLPQVGPFRCQWRLTVGIFSIRYTLAQAPWFITTLRIGDNLGNQWFNAVPTSLTKCFTEFTNEIVACGVDWFGKFGVGHVTWSPGPRKIANDYNFMKHENTMAEVFPIDEQFQVIKLCNVPMKSNCKFKYDTEYDPYQNELENFPTPWPNFQDQE